MKSNKAYKFDLDTSSKKFICPNCREKTFVKYLDQSRSKYLEGKYGRCDRESNCGYHLWPQEDKIYCKIQFYSCIEISKKALRITLTDGLIFTVPKTQVRDLGKNECFIARWYLEQKNIPTITLEELSFENNYSISLIESVRKLPEKSSFHNLDLICSLDKSNCLDNLSNYLLKFFDFASVRRMMVDYLIGVTDERWPNSTIFWQIDENECVRAGKIMNYDANGKRIKKPYPRMYWVHKALNLKDFKLKQCLFGLHLVREDYTKTIAIVESEKTAVIMSIVMPEFIWLATGGKSNLSLLKLNPIRGRDIVLFPDKGEFEDWSAKAEVFGKEGHMIRVSDLIENRDIEKGEDLADFFVKSNQH